MAFPNVISAVSQLPVSSISQLRDVNSYNPANGSILTYSYSSNTYYFSNSISVSNTSITLNVNTSIGILNVNKLTIANGPTWTSGNGVPTSVQPLGSLYSRQDGTLGQTLYVSRGANTWNAVAGV